METERDGNIGEISKNVSSIVVYLIFYTFTKKREQWSHFSKVSVHFVCLSAVGGSEQTGRAVWGPWVRSTRQNQTADVTFGAIFII